MYVVKSCCYTIPQNKVYKTFRGYKSNVTYPHKVVNLNTLPTHIHVNMYYVGKSTVRFTVHNTQNNRRQDLSLVQFVNMYF